MEAGFEVYLMLLPKIHDLTRLTFSCFAHFVVREIHDIGLVVGSPGLSNKRLRCEARTLRLQEIR